MRPAIFIHLKQNIKFLEYCIVNFKDICDIIVNCYGNKPDIIEFCRQNSNHFYQIEVGSKIDIVKSLPFLFADGVWVCNDDVEIQGDVMGMFKYANSDKQYIDLVYPPTDNLLLDNTKIGIHNRHRLNSSAFFLTEAGIKKLRLGHPLSYTHTYYGANIQHVQKIKSIVPVLGETLITYPTEEFFPLRIAVEKQLLDVVNNDVFPINTKNAVITFTTQDRNFISQTKETIENISNVWQADFKIYSDITELMTEEQQNVFSKIKSKRPNIVSYFAKMLCIYHALKEYDRVLWIDDTCIFSPFAQNLFSVVPPEKFGGLVIKQSYNMNECNNDREYIKTARNIDVDDVYINTGVVLVSKCHQHIFSFEDMLSDIDLFESFYPTQAYLVYKITVGKIPVYDITTINHFMPCMLKYEDKLFMHTTSLSSNIKTIAAHSIVHFSGFHKYREILHQKINNIFNSIFNQKITLVLMNFSRPENIKQRILPFYTKIPAINQIIISHCKKSAMFEYKSTSHCEIIHRDDTENDKQYGLFTRYIAAAESSRNNCVVVVDDDMIIPAHVLAQLFYEWKKQPTKIYGTRGRLIEKINGHWVYNSNDFVNNADIVLTHCAMTSKHVLTKLIDQEHIFHDTAMQSQVPWNGEDIMLSLFAKFLNQDKNKTIHCKYIDLPENEAISSTKDHNEVRDKLTDEINRYYMKKIYKAII